MSISIFDKRVAYLDGMRGLAILLVGLGHIFVEVNVFKIGWIGLNLFFILSGFLISQRLYHHLGEGDKYGYFKKFYHRRALRILPLYFAVLFFYFIILPWFYSNYTLYYFDLRNAQMWYWTFLSNWWMIIYGLPKTPDLFHFWSLAVEEQFYLCWPFLFLFFNSGRNQFYGILFLIVCCSLFRATQQSPFNTYLNPITAAEPLLFGCFVCICVHKNVLEKFYTAIALLAIASIFGLIFVFSKNSNFTIDNRFLLKYGYSFINILFVFFLTTCILTKYLSNSMRRFFSLNWLVWLGKYSYGIYIFHWIILKVFAYKLENILTQMHVAKIISYLLPRLLVILSCLLLSYYSYHFYEKKFLKLKTHIA